MRIFQVNGRWFAKLDHHFGAPEYKHITAQRGPFKEMPKPIRRWVEARYHNGMLFSESIFTAFAAGRKRFTLEEQAHHYDGGTLPKREYFLDKREPSVQPEYGEAYTWEGGAWRKSQQPHTLKVWELPAQSGLLKENSV